MLCCTAFFVLWNLYGDCISVVAGRLGDYCMTAVGVVIIWDIVGCISSVLLILGLFRTWLLL
jgi:hypothetical protein